MGRQKVEVANTPEISLLYLAAAHDLSAVKYGTYNWRDIPIKARDYISAIRRHLMQFASGEDIDSESGLPHLACAMAGCSVLLDAMEHGCLIDDRAAVEGFSRTMRIITELKKGWVADKAAREAA